MEKDKIVISASKQLAVSTIVKYWEDLYKADLLKYRLGNIANPDMSNVASVLARQSKYIFYVLAPTHDEYWGIVGEFSLIPFRGSCKIIHFSVHPDNLFKDNILFCKTATDYILSSSFGEPDTFTNARSLLGFTPVPNRQARLLISKVGFKKIETIPASGYYLGKVCDAVVTLKVSKEAN